MIVQKRLHITAVSIVAHIVTASLCRGEVVEPRATWSKYESVFQECPRFAEVMERRRGMADITKDVYSESIAAEARVNSLVEFGMQCPVEDIPWNRLLEVASKPDTPESVVLWSVIVAGKRLCDTSYPKELERWLFARLSNAPNSPQAQAAIVVLGISGVGRNAALRIWARLLRDPATSNQTCECICKYAASLGGVYKVGTLDEGINCLLAGYDEEIATPERREVLCEWLALACSAILRRSQVETATLWSVHQLGEREFAKDSNSERLRVKATILIQSREPIATESVIAAKKCLEGASTTKELKAAAGSVVRQAERFGEY